MAALDPKVYIVDDDEAVRESLALLLDSMDQNCQGFNSAVDFLDSYSGNMTGCLVLDIRMPGMNGLELQKQLNVQGCILPIIFVTGHGDVPMAVEAMQHGAVDFIQKPYREQDLLDKINMALALDKTNREALEHRHKIIEKLAALTPREKEVMEMMVDGKANKVIAIDLGISQRTVEIHRSRVMEKMATNSLAHLVKMVVAVENA
ncbi:MAG: two-component system response regulator FixJ [Pseudomonadales bacterium]|jgi:two-component system response regulator FixJ